jgi:predicted Fe-Mo cluster-binding NifX family protein
MERVAIPVYEARVSPVLDTCVRMLVVDIDGGSELKRSEVFLEQMSVYERSEALMRWGIKKIICAGVSELMCRLLKSRKIEMINGIAGEVEKIIHAYCCGNLSDSCFCMPGKHDNEAP